MQNFEEKKMNFLELILVIEQMLIYNAWINIQVFNFAIWEEGGGGGGGEIPLLSYAEQIDLV